MSRGDWCMPCCLLLVLWKSNPGAEKKTQTCFPKNQFIAAGGNQGKVRDRVGLTTSIIRFTCDDCSLQLPPRDRLVQRVAFLAPRASHHPTWTSLQLAQRANHAQTCLSSALLKPRKPHSTTFDLVRGRGGSPLASTRAFSRRRHVK